MAKRKITVTVDESLVEQARALDGSLSAVVNQALIEHVEHEAQLIALGEMLDAIEAEQGPPSAEALAAAEAAFDEAEGRIAREGAA